MSEEGFSVEQSEELIANLKSGKPSEFEHLRSALNLLAHVPEISPVSAPPVLPSTITQPAPVVPIRSSKPRRTIVTSIIVMGLFASGSLAAAAVTGIGPSIFVNAGHSAAKFVKNVVGGVTHVVTGNTSDSNQNQASGDTNPGGSTSSPTSSTAPTTPTAPTAPGSTSNTTDENGQNNSEQSSLNLPQISKLIPPLSTTILTNSGSHENDSQSPSSSPETQGPSSQENQKKTPEAQRTPSSVEDQNQSESHHTKTPEAQRTQSSGEDQNQSESHPVEKPTPDASATPSAQPTSQPTNFPRTPPSIFPTGSSDDSESEN